MNNPNAPVKSFAETMTRKERTYLLEHWKKNIAAVKLAAPNTTNDDHLKLARVLENTDRAIRSAMKKFEGTQVPDIGPFRMHVFDIITALYPSQIADELVSVQTMSQKVAQIFFLRYLYGSSKGKIGKGTDMLNPWTGAAPYNNYSGEEIEEEVLGAGGGTEYNTFLEYIPVRKGTVVITADAATYVDKGDGKIYNASNTQVGTINYETGAIDITITQTTEDPTVSYTYDLEYGPSKSGEVNVKVDETLITARPHYMRALYAFSAGYDLEMSQGIKIDDAILEACTAELRHERDGLIIDQLFKQAANTSTWNRKIPTALTQKEHYESFIAEIFFCASRIFSDTKRAYGNWVVVGKQGIDILTAVGAPRFVGSGVIAPAGPHYAGILDNRMKVYFNPFLGEDEYLVGYKGNLFLDAGFILGDYLPVFASQLIMLDDFVGRRGFASLYGTKMVNNRMYVKGQITNI